jgi:nucleoside-diphosphate-sugar epimerase
VARILLTGGNGFVGRALAPVLAARHELRVTLRRAPDRLPPPGAESLILGEIGPATEWAPALAGIDTIIHLAARAHADESRDPGAYRRINAEGTRRLAESARRAGIGRVIFLSTVKVNGEATLDHPFCETDPPAPVGPYAVSKLDAERSLAAMAAAGGPAAVILRPPLVYGSGVKANMAALLRLCAWGVPLPFGAVANQRSLLFLGNLVDAILRVVETPPVPGCRTYLLRDGDDLSTAAIVEHLARGLGRRPRLLPVPPSWLRAALTLAGKGAAADRLLSSLTVDDSAFRRDFAWRPPFTAAAGLAETAAWYRAQAAGRGEAGKARVSPQRHGGH